MNTPEPDEKVPPLHNKVKRITITKRQDSGEIIWFEGIEGKEIFKATFFLVMTSFYLLYILIILKCKP